MDASLEGMVSEVNTTHVAHVVRWVGCEDIQLGMAFVSDGAVHRINAKDVKEGLYIMNLLDGQWRDKLANGIWAIDFAASRDSKEWWQA